MVKAIAILLFLISIGALIRWGITSYVFRIRIVAGFPIMRGDVPGRSRSEILGFVRGLDLPEGAMITGLKDGDRFRIVLSRAVPEEHQQRIRNFLYLR